MLPGFGAGRGIAPEGFGVTGGFGKSVGSGEEICGAAGVSFFSTTSDCSATSVVGAAAFLVAAFLVAAFFAGFASAAGLTAGGYFSRNLRTTGGSTVDDADLTNSPISWSFARTSLLSIPKSFANS